MMRVLVVDDHSLFRDGIVSLLEAAGYTVVGQAGDGKTAVERALSLRPELVLLDIHMPEMNGIDALKFIKASLPETKVVMLTVSEDEAYLVDAITSGADGYLLKHLSGPEFIDMLEGLKHGEAAITRKTASFLMKRMSQPVSAQPENAAGVLTGREIGILELVAGGLSNKAISDQLSLSENTIKYHLKNILQKLNVQNRTEAVMYALRNKLIQKP
jgi:DNA-binding NarL/FixJ family response regulator